jgi:uncharacterized protein YjbI with pentapeptide repeats
MANNEQLELLKRGATEWNKWRKEHPGVAPDLSSANLREARLRGSNLRGANMVGVTLYGADLENASLDDANLRGAELNFADLSLAQMWNTDFSDAELRFVNMTRSDVRGANFEGASFGWTILGYVNLNEARGLDKAKHDGPSTIGIDTIQRSGGEIPEVFLRGAGVSEEFITYARSLIEAGNVIQFYSCFISYSSKDQDFAERLHADLQRKGVRCWFAPEDLRIGDRFRDRIDESIRLHDKLLLILSENSVSSQWVGDEVEAAFERERGENRTVLFPIQIDSAITENSKGWAAAIRRTRHIGDFNRWKDHDSYQKAFDRLLRDLKAET